MSAEERKANIGERQLIDCKQLFRRHQRGDGFPLFTFPVMARCWDLQWLAFHRGSGNGELEMSHGSQHGDFASPGDI